MSMAVPYIPHDQLASGVIDENLVADVCELSAFFSEDDCFLLSDIRNDIEIGNDEYKDVDEHNSGSEAVINCAAGTLERRAHHLGEAYPFELDESGSMLEFKSKDGEWAHYSYMLCLVLSHLKGVTPVLSQAGLLPKNTGDLRKWFQQVAAPALAAEVSGHGWAFGWPRPDASAFLQKLQDIWTEIGDGSVRSSPLSHAPKKVKDDEIDVIAARPHWDGGPGFPIAMAQVASGKNWTSKSVRNAVDNWFFQEWFDVEPESQTTCFHIIPFALTVEQMARNTRILGHILHRIRLVKLVTDAASGVSDGVVHTEGVDAFEELSVWLERYRAGLEFDAA